MMSEEKKKRCFLQYEMSALKWDGEVFALSHTTTAAALTVICGAVDTAVCFGFRVMCEFQAALLASAALRLSREERRASTAQLVFERVMSVAMNNSDWMAIYVDANCVRVFGRGSFACYFLDGTQHFSAVGGFLDESLYDKEHSLVECEALTLIVTNAAQQHSDERVRCLIEASRNVKCTTDSLAVAFVNWIATDSSFCVLTLSARRINDEANRVESPRKSELRVLDSHSDCIKMSRHCITQSSDVIDIEVQ